MRQIWSIATKELRGYFSSAVALIFLLAFLFVVLATFFWVDKFFARDLADVRPLFERMPLLLIFLVSALTMRLWSEEHKTGTIELLLTLPVPIHRLVIGKFLAGLVLVAIALALTLGVPITVEWIGDLDWGPVFGGYLAALLLASMYLALGLCVSAGTDNQIVSLLLTAALCGLLYLPGADAVAGAFGVGTGEALRLIGTGSRFDSIARGVLDLRDLAYYAGWVVLLLAINTVILKARRWSAARHTAPRRRQTVLAIALIGVNALALNLWLTPVTAARVDLTADGAYSLSAPTEKLLGSLDEPLRIHGYFSADEMHPVLKPLVPQIRDLLDEYKIAGGSRVQLAFMDPSKDEELEQELSEQYNIKSQPFKISDRHGTAVKNAFFYVLVAYGDQFEVLGVDDLIEVEAIDVGDIDVRLKNLEYQVTRAIRKVVYGFQSLDALFASLPDEVSLELYITPDTLPEEMRAIPETVRKVAGEVAASSSGKLVFREITPQTDEERQELYNKYNVQPLPMSLFVGKYIYLDLLLRMGDKVIRIALPSEPEESALREGIDEALELVVPGFIKVVGMVVPEAPPPQQFHPSMPPQRMPPPQSFDRLQQALQASYEVRPVDLSTEVPSDIDVLVVAGPDSLNAQQQRNIDQHLMRGRSVILLVGNYRLDRASRGLAVEKVSTGVNVLLEGYGLELGDGIVMDVENITFPAPSSGPTEKFVDLERPYFLKVVERGRRGGGTITSWLGDVILHWASPITLKQPDGEEGDAGGESVETMVLLASTGKAWLKRDVDLNSGLTRPETVAEGDAGPHTLAVAMIGSIDSAFADKAQDPLQLGKEGEAPSGDRGDRTLRRSPPGTRLVVVGSSAFASDVMLEVGRQLGTREVDNNLKLLLSLVDWSVADEELLAIRAHGGRVRTLDVEDDETGKWEIINYVLAVFGLALVIGFSWVQRRAMLASFEAMGGKPAARAGVRSSDSKAKPAAKGAEPAARAAPKEKEKAKAKAKPKDKPTARKTVAETPAAKAKDKAEAEGEDKDGAEAEGEAKDKAEAEGEDKDKAEAEGEAKDGAEAADQPEAKAKDDAEAADQPEAKAKDDAEAADQGKVDADAGPDDDDDDDDEEASK